MEHANSDQTPEEGRILPQLFVVVHLSTPEVYSFAYSEWHNLGHGSAERADRDFPGRAQARMAVGARLELGPFTPAIEGVSLDWCT